MRISSLLVQVSNVQRGNGRVQNLGHGSTHGGGNLGFHGQFENNKLQFKSRWNQRVGIVNLATAQESLGDEYLENNCVDDPVKLCDFQLLENRIMKTVDSVYQVGNPSNHGYSAFISLLKAKILWSVFRCDCYTSLKHMGKRTCWSQANG